VLISNWLGIVSGQMKMKPGEGFAAIPGLRRESVDGLGAGRPRSDIYAASRCEPSFLDREALEPQLVKTIGRDSVRAIQVISESLRREQVPGAFSCCESSFGAA
jgi:hypothetical protein